MSARHDVVIVGGRSAGCVLASRLSEDPDRSVLLIEAGPAYAPDAYPPDLTTGSMVAVEPRRTWGYESVPGRAGHAIAAYAGRVLGGGSAINAGIARRGRPSDFARWVAHGLPDWSWDAVLDAYKALENTPDGDDAWHGRSGPWPVRQSTPESLTPPVRAFLDAAAALGFARVDDFNGADQHGIGGEVKNLVGGVRQNTGMVYLSPAVRARPNLTIRADTLVDRVGFEGRRATGVHLADGSTIPAGEAVLSAGVYGSPTILLRSGVGPAAHLSAKRVAVVADLPVGERLRDQPMYALAYVLKADAGAEPPDGSGVLWTASSEAARDELDLQLSISVQPDVDPAGAPVRVMRLWASVVTPRSTGTLRLKSLDPHVNPRIDYALLSEPTDERRLREIVGLGRRVMRLDPVASLVAAELAPGPDATSDDALEAAIRAGLITFYRGTSSVPMGGAEDPAAVVDGSGRVRGLDGLRVVDASIFPEPISVPVNLTTIMLAERIAGWMRAATGGQALVRSRDDLAGEGPTHPPAPPGRYQHHQSR